MKTKLMKVATIIGVTLFSSIASAEQSSDALGGCMADSMTGKERKQVAEWVFFAMAAHPDMKGFSKVTADARNKSNEFVGKLITRLLTENCPAQTKQAVKDRGSVALKEAFEVVGRVAMQELMTNKDVATSMSGFDKFLNKDKLNAIVSAK